MTQALPKPARPARRLTEPAPPRTRTPRSPSARDSQSVLARSRPSAERAAAAALLVRPARSNPAPDRQQKAPDRHLKVVDDSAHSAGRRRNRFRMLVALAVLAIAAAAFLAVYMHVVMAQRQFALDNTQNEVAQQQLSYERLRLQVAELSSPQHVIQMAEGKLGMIQPTGVTYLTPSTIIDGKTPSLATPESTGGAASTGSISGDADWPVIKSQLAAAP